MEGGIGIVLTLLIVFGVAVGGVALFGAGGWVRKRELQGEDDEEQPSRPQHTVVEDDGADVQLPRRPPSRTKPPE